MSAPSPLSLDGRRVLVVGASSGIGRAFAQHALADGARVAMSARRADRLSALVEGNSAGVPVAGDVRIAADCRRMVDDAVTALGMLDLLVYSAGAAPLRPLVDTTAADWATVLETHVLGVHHVVQAALGKLSPGGIIAVLSSETVGNPRFGLGAYGASKAALEESIRAWRCEHPSPRFTTIAVGSTFPTEFGHDFDPDLLTLALNDWAGRGLIPQHMLDPKDVAGTLAGILAVALAYPGVGIEHLVLRPSSPVAPDASALVGQARP